VAARMYSPGRGMGLRLMMDRLAAATATGSATTAAVWGLEWLSASGAGLRLLGVRFWVGFWRFGRPAWVGEAWGAWRLHRNEKSFLVISCAMKVMLKMAG
jgi:hypothetical protein